jgi:hypothetical protein
METAIRKLVRMQESDTVMEFLISFPSGTDVWMWPGIMLKNNDNFVV